MATGRGTDESEHTSMNETEHVALRLPAQAKYIRVARLVGAGLANDLGADLETLDDIRLAIGEVCALAVQVGAETVDLRFAVYDGTLRVDGEAPTDPPAALLGDPTAEQLSAGAVGTDEHVALVEQILGVACSDHRVTRESTGLSFRLTFDHGG